MQNTSSNVKKSKTKESENFPLYEQKTIAPALSLRYECNEHNFLHVVSKFKYNCAK